jgi:hypothetical protein
MRKRIVIELTVEEWERLVEVALKRHRDPREQAAFMLAIALGVAEQEPAVAR